MKKKVVFVERRACEFVSLENVFAAVATGLDPDRYTIEFVKLPYGNGLLGTLANLLYFRPPAADIYHITGHVHYIALTLPPDRTVLTIHDLGLLRRRRGLRRWLLKKLLVTWPMKRLRFVTAISEQTKAEIDEFSGSTGRNVTIIGNPVLPHFFAGTAREFNRERPRILHIGTSPNKNLETLIDALEGLSAELRIIGPVGARQAAELDGRNIAWSSAAGLSDEEMVAEYERADVVAFCSTYEGFGLPIIEAQAMARPVVTSNLTPMKEVAGAGAVLVNPLESSEIKRALRRLIEDAEFRNGVVRAGSLNVERFRPKAIAERYAALYEEILQHQ